MLLKADKNKIRQKRHLRVRNHVAGTAERPRLNVFRSLKLTSNRFGIEPEVTARLADMDLRIFEIPISYKPRSGKEGKKIGWKDGVMAMWYIVKFNLFS